MNSIFDVFIIGSGPAGCTAAIYAVRGGASAALCLGPVPGGLMTTTEKVENFPGFISISGKELTTKMIEHAAYYGTTLIKDKVLSIIRNEEENNFLIKTDENEYKSKTVILSTGAHHKKLGIESEIKYESKGVSYCAICDGFFFRREDVAVIGGGNSAVEDAIYLSSIVNKVYLIHRRNTLRAEKILQDRLFSLKNVEILWDSIVEEFQGDDNALSGILIRNSITNETRVINATGAFIAVGYSPNNMLGINFCNILEGGYLKNEKYGITKTPGFFVAGDVHDAHNRQAITAAGYGCEAGLSALKYLQQYKQR